MGGGGRPSLAVTKTRGDGLAAAGRPRRTHERTQTNAQHAHHNTPPKPALLTGIHSAKLAIAAALRRHSGEGGCDTIYYYYHSLLSFSSTHGNVDRDELQVLPPAAHLRTGTRCRGQAAGSRGPAIRVAQTRGGGRVVIGHTLCARLQLLPTPPTLPPPPPPATTSSPARPTCSLVRPVTNPNAYSPCLGCRIRQHSWKALAASLSGLSAALTCLDAE